MPIPFTQYVRPNGRKRLVSIEMPAYVEELADKFIEGGLPSARIVIKPNFVDLPAIEPAALPACIRQVNR